MGSDPQHHWQERFLDANGHRMAWHEIGRGPTLVCLHGGYDYLLNRPMAELLADRYRCVLYDQRGAGRSRLDPPDEESMHFSRFV
jgi:pimeloyl-ACP methyl ester carboxylesterase